MSNRKNELDVDLIGDPHSPLTEEEKKALNNYFNAKKAKERKIVSAPKKRTAKRKKSLI